MKRYPLSIDNRDKDEVISYLEARVAVLTERIRELEQELNAKENHGREQAVSSPREEVRRGEGQTG